MGRITGLDQGIGTLLGFFLRGRKEREQTKGLEEQIELLKQERMRREAESLPSGAPVDVAPMATPPPPQTKGTFGGFLKSLGGDFVGGLTPGSSDIDRLTGQLGQEKILFKEALDEQAARRKQDRALEELRREYGYKGSLEEFKQTMIGQRTQEEQRAITDRTREQTAGRIQAREIGARAQIDAANISAAAQKEAAAIRANAPGKPSKPPSPAVMAEKASKMRNLVTEFSQSVSRGYGGLKDQFANPDAAKMAYESLRDTVEGWNSAVEPQYRVRVPEFNPGKKTGFFDFERDVPPSVTMPVRPGAKTDPLVDKVLNMLRTGEASAQDVQSSQKLTPQQKKYILDALGQ